MPWEFTDNVHAFAEHTWEFLASRPVENTVALTMIENLRAGLQYSEQPPLLGWHRGGATSAAMTLTLPYELVLAAMSDGAMDELVSALRARRSRLPGVTADAATAERFATAWTTGSPARVTTIAQNRLYAVDALRPPTPQPPGRPRQAGGNDIDVAARWLTAFQEETGSHVVDTRPVVRDRIENALLWLWEDDAGIPVSLAGRHRPAAGVARVGPVYTPPEHRRHGYGASVTAACTGDALAHGAQHVVLFTDLANPTSNAIYQQIGYRPVSDHSIIRFDELRPG
jgi:predicted GNAT family acetyltransferase